MSENFDYIRCCRSPIPNQYFIWYGMYNDGSIVVEFDNNQVETNFNEINKPELSRFGLLGNGGRVFFNTSDGIIHLDTTRTFNVYLVDENNNEYPISGIEGKEYKDIIQYKKGYIDAKMCRGRAIQQGKMTPYEHYFGYKIDVDSIPDNVIKAQVIYCLPIRGTISITVKLNSLNKEFKGKLIAKYGGNKESIDINLSRATTNEFKIYGL